MKTIISALISIILASLAFSQESRIVKVNVIAEDATPLEGVNTTITFLGYSGADTLRKKGKTDEEGVFKARGIPTLRMSVIIEKKGYYTTQSGRLSRKQNHDVTYVLRKKENPIPLYAKHFQGEVPSIGQKCGFDFEVGDWVAPHGAGKRSDFTVLAQKEYGDPKNYQTSVMVEFVDSLSGLIEDAHSKNEQTQLSSFSTARTAKRNGKYKSQYSFALQRNGINGRKGSTGLSSFIFRTRVNLDENGEIETCHYGKMIKAVNVAKGAGKPRQKPIISFTYYFNPTPNDQNLEFDPKRNLFKRLETTAQVHAP